MNQLYTIRGFTCKNEVLDFQCFLCNVHTIIRPQTYHLIITLHSSQVQPSSPIELGGGIENWERLFKEITRLSGSLLEGGTVCSDQWERYICMKCCVSHYEGLKRIRDDKKRIQENLNT